MLLHPLPRLARQWSHLSRQKGSVQQRGKGEKQIKVAPRLLRRSMPSKDSSPFMTYQQQTGRKSSRHP